MRAKLSSILAAGAAALLLSTASAFAELLNFSAELMGAAEVPPNESTGTGTLTADYDTETKLFKWSISYQGLSGPATAAHFHGPANPDEVADPVLPVSLEPAAAGAEAETPAEEAEPEAPAEAEPTIPAEPEAPAEAEPEAPAGAEAETGNGAEAEAPAEAEPVTPTEAEPAASAEGQPGSPADPEAANQITGEATLTDEQAADLQTGKWYFNIHTAQYPDGELRGQLPAYQE